MSSAPNRLESELLERAFLGALDERRRHAVAKLPELGERLLDLHAAAVEAAAPELPVDPARFAADIALRLPDEPDEPDANVIDYLEHCRAGDLHLAACCARGEPGAVAVFQRTFSPDLGALTRRFANLDHRAEDLRQILLECLFVGDRGGRPPRIADYAGQGSLRNWLRVLAVRTFINLGKRKDRARETAADEHALLALPDAVDLELDFVKHAYRAVLTQALFDAARALAPGDRHLLRQHLVGGMSVDQLGAVYGIHRATAARRIVRAREQLLAGVRTAMSERLGVSEEELESLVRAISSRLDASLARLLATPAR